MWDWQKRGLAEVLWVLRVHGMRLEMGEIVCNFCNRCEKIAQQKVVCKEEEGTKDSGFGWLLRCTARVFT